MKYAVSEKVDRTETRSTGNSPSLAGMWKVLRRNHSTVSSSGPELVDISWKRLGVPASVAATLRSVFPHIAKPTKVQARLIPAILSGKDVLLKDHTGTGKYVEFHTPVSVHHASDQSTELQVVWFNLSLAQ